MVLPKVLDNMDGSGSLTVIPLPFASFEQTVTNSTTMTTGITYTVKPVAGTGPNNIWNSISVSGGITIDNNGTITFTQPGRYLAMFQGSIGGSIEPGRVRYQLLKIGAATNQFWIYAHHDIPIAGSTRTHDTGVYQVAAGDTFQLNVLVEDTWQLSYQAMIVYNRLVIYMIG